MTRQGEWPQGSRWQTWQDQNVDHGIWLNSQVQGPGGKGEFKVHDDQVSDLETERELATAEWRNVVDHKPHKADSHHSLLFHAEENNFAYLLCKITRDMCHNSFGVEKKPRKQSDFLASALEKRQILGSGGFFSAGCCWNAHFHFLATLSIVLCAILVTPASIAGRFLA